MSTSGRERRAGVASLRAIGVLLFVLFNTAHAGAFLGEPLAALVSRLETLATDIFFILSGFLLYRPFVAARWAGEPLPSLRRYAARRLGRILPAYWFALTVSGLTVGLPGFFSRSAWQQYLLLTPYFHWNDPLPGMGVAWSLSVIATFSLLLPLFAALRHRRPPRVAGELIVLGAIAGAGIAVQAEYVLSGGTLGRLNMILPGQLAPFAAGMALAVWSVTAGRRAGRLAGALRRLPGVLCWAPAVLLYWIACRRAGIPPVGASIQAFTVSSWLAAQLLPVVTAALLITPAALGAAERGLPGLVLSSPPLEWLGGLAYGLYLWFSIPLGPLLRSGIWGRADIADLVLLTGATVALTVPLALLSRRLVESPVAVLTATVADGERRDDDAEEQEREQLWAPRPERSAVAG